MLAVLATIFMSSSRHSQSAKKENETVTNNDYNVGLVNVNEETFDPKKVTMILTFLVIRWLRLCLRRLHF